ncbi:unnamed protein product [Amoebophrya sp. A120]|nr:unnamed protein product [Amoebophrya sp. A120]|eukprot:GSA120T00007849001.1
MNKQVEIQLQPGSNPFWFAILDGLHPLRPEERLFRATRCIMTQVIVERDHDSRRVFEADNFVNEDFFSSNVHVFEYYGAKAPKAEQIRDFHVRDFDKHFLLDPSSFPKITDVNSGVGQGAHFNPLAPDVGGSCPVEALPRDEDWTFMEELDTDLPEDSVIDNFLKTKMRLRDDCRKDLLAQAGVFSYVKIQIQNKFLPRQTFETYVSLRAILQDPGRWLKGVWLDLLPPNAGLDPSVMHNLSLQRGRFKTNTPKIKVCAGLGLSDAHIQSLLEPNLGPSWTDVLREGFQETAHQLSIARAELASHGLELSTGGVAGGTSNVGDKNKNPNEFSSAATTTSGATVSKRPRSDAKSLKHLHLEKEEWRLHTWNLASLVDQLRRDVLQKEQDVRDYFLRDQPLKISIPIVDSGTSGTSGEIRGASGAAVMNAGSMQQKNKPSGAGGGGNSGRGTEMQRPVKNVPVVTKVAQRKMARMQYV